MTLFVIILLLMLIESIISSSVPSFRLKFKTDIHNNENNKVEELAAVFPGNSVVNGVLFQGIVNGISLYSNVIFFRVALSFFPDARKQFPILKPIFTVTNPYLKVFRKRIPPVSIGGAQIDISAIPAIFILDLFSQGTVALGAEIPQAFKKQLQGRKETTTKPTKTTAR